MTSAISVAGLTRSYRGQLALDRVSFDVAPGSITGLLGRNGAGKTTLLRILTGHEFPSAGSVRVFGAGPAENDQVLRRIVLVAAPPLRASHADRDLAVDILCAAAGDGRLTAAELDERLETALTARTVGELATVTADLPGGTMLRAAGQRHPAQVTRRYSPVYADDPAASRWTLRRSLLDA